MSMSRNSFFSNTFQYNVSGFVITSLYALFTNRRAMHSSGSTAFTTLEANFSSFMRISSGIPHVLTSPVIGTVCTSYPNMFR